MASYPSYNKNKAIADKSSKGKRTLVYLTPNGTYIVQTGDYGYDPQPDMIYLDTKEDLIALHAALGEAIASNEPVPIDDSII